MKTALDNRYLKVNPGVVLAPIAEKVIIAMDAEFEAEGKVAYVTSCVRTEESQLSVIRGYLTKMGLDKTYPDAMVCKVEDKKTWEGEVVYMWQPGWSALLNAGVIINPPLDAVCLMDYIGAGGKNRKGEVIHASAHIRGQKTQVFDIGGGKDGIDGNVVSEQKIVQKAIDKKMPGVVSMVIEHKNNCVHVNCCEY